LAAGTSDSRRRALVTGLTGQDGSFLAELLLENDYQVTGLVRRPPGEPLGCAEHLRERVALLRGDLLDPPSLVAAVIDARPDELYHLASPSFVPASWNDPALTIRAITGSTATLLAAVRDHSPGTRMCVAASGAMFGDTSTSPQREDTPCRPQTPYATAKLAAHQLVGLLRRHDGVFACSAILYNHESERRPESFVPRKLTRAAAAIKLGQASDVELGDLDSVRDWSFAGDIVRGMWLTLQQDDADDYILATGHPHTVAELARTAFATVGLNAEDHIRVEPGLERGPESTPPVGDPTRARERLGWHAETTFEQLIERMVQADLRALQSAA
jgi:GDPmannose 4,6-dehydratase